MSQFESPDHLAPAEALHPMLLIVVGAHPESERGDRPTAYALGRAMSTKFAASQIPAEVLVLSDVWYLNDPSLRHWPAISLGSPDVNALTATLADKLPSMLVVDGTWMIQFEPDWSEPRAAIWGVRSSATAAAVESFLARHADGLVRACANLWSID